MPALATLFATEPTAPFSGYLNIPASDAPFAQGSEGRKVLERAEEVARHWHQRAEVLLMPRKEAGDFSYQHVPPNRVFYVKTRYVYVGKGLPRPFDLDDE